MATERLEATVKVLTGDATKREWWLFSPRVDLCVFAGSAFVSLLLLWAGARAGVLDSDAPEWAWVPAVLLVDVAHVYATAFRVYFDTEELRRRAWLYALVPVIGLGLGAALYSESEALFWRTLAYLAVFHFVRQQYGWVALYRARVGRARALGLVGGRGGGLHGDNLSARLLARAPAEEVLVVPRGRLRGAARDG